MRERTERPVGLRPHLERAFEQPQVSIDFAGFSGETLHGALQEPLDKIRIGRHVPESIAIRILLPDVSRPMGLPCRVEDMGDDPEFRERTARITQRSILAIIDSVQELAELGLVFFGFYPVREHALTLKGEPRTVYDLMGKDATLFHHARTDDDASAESQYVEQARAWFDSMWTTVAREPTP